MDLLDNTPFSDLIAGFYVEQASFDGIVNDGLDG